MLPLTTLILSLSLPLALAAGPANVPPGSGQVTRPVEWFPDPAQPDRQFAGQTAPDGKLVLSASNGFFDSGIRAGGEATDKDGSGEEFIVPDFAWLDSWTEPGSTARWHFWVEKPGALTARVHMSIPAESAGSRLSATVGSTTRTFTTRLTKDAEPQGEPLTFPIAKPGWHTLTLRLESGKSAGRLHQVELCGPAAEGARLLRARWRPAACHARFSSSAVQSPQLWVMSTRPSPDARVDSYSPVTTPFGYYGCSFDASGQSTGSANFSLWSYPKGKPTPQDQWSHLLATGSPLATFGAFGHEGSGVKLRGDWKPFAGSHEVTLALRCEVERPWVRWFGYYLDPATHRFRLYGAGTTFLADGKRPPSLNPGAFVEQPGPPDRERSGDLVRDIQRRGWMLDESKHWHPIDTMSSGKAGERAAKHWRTTPDGWFSMGMGGMPWYTGTGKPVTLPAAAAPLPAWLGGTALDDLCRLPARIGPRQISQITRDSAALTFTLTDLALAPGESATVTVYHGPEDCLTFAEDPGYREVKARTWPRHTEPVKLGEGNHTLPLTGLTPGAANCLRILIESPRGRLWSFTTDRLETLP